MTAQHHVSLSCDECGTGFSALQATSIRQARKIAKADQGWTIRHHGNQDVCGECTRRQEDREELSDEDRDLAQFYKGMP